jgi:hypothetical protein
MDSRTMMMVKNDEDDEGEWEGARVMAVEAVRPAV